MNKIFILAAILLFSLLTQGQEIKLVLPIGHFAGVKSAEFSLSQKLILTTEWFGNSAKIWDASTGKLLRTLETLNGLASAYFNADATKVIIADARNGDVKIIDVKTGEYYPNNYYSFHTEINDAKFSPDGKWFSVAADDSTATISDYSNNKIIFSIKDDEKVSSVEFSPDGKKVVTISHFGTCKVWDVLTKNLLLKNPTPINLNGNNSLASSILPECAQFNQNGEKLAIGYYTGALEIWDINQKTTLKIDAATQKINSVQFSPDGKKILTASDDSTAKLWDAETGQLLTNLNKHKDKVTSASFNIDGSMILTSSYDGCCMLWKINKKSPEYILRANEHGINYGRFSIDSKKIITASNDHTAKVWDIKTKQVLTTCMGHTKSVWNTFLYDKEKLVTVFYNYCQFWDLKTGELLGRIQCPESGVEIKFSTDRIITYSRSKENMYSIRLWDKTTFELIDSLPGHKSEITAVIFSPNGKRLITGSKEGSCKLWDTETGKLIFNFDKHKDDVWWAEFNANATKVLTGSHDTTVKIWDCTNGTVIKTLTGCGRHLSRFFYSPDYSKIITCFDKCIKIWDSGGSLLSITKNHPSYIHTCIFSNKAKMMLTASDSLLLVNDVESGREIFCLQNKRISFAYFSQDDSKIITTNDTLVQVWNVNSGKLLWKLGGHRNFVRSVDYGSRLNEIITTTDAGEIKYWDIDSGKELQDYSGTFSPLTPIFFDNGTFVSHDDSKVIITNSKTKETIFLIPIDTTDWVYLHPSGLFDASQGAMEKLYWVRELETIDFNQLKERYWQPGLYQMVMQGQPLRDISGMDELKLQPEVNVEEIRDNILTIHLTKREGGYGKISIKINDKEIIEDARPQNFDLSKEKQTISINLKQHLLPGIENLISVKAWDSEDYVSSKSVSITHRDDSKSSLKKPSFFAIICGTGQYNNPNIGLKYAASDARAIAKAITIGAENEFGKDKTHIFLLTSPGNNPTTKINIKNAFDKIRTKARPEDVILIYLSGHGFTLGGENGDFYYLTAEATVDNAQSLADPVLRKSQSISTLELTKWLKEIPALKRVMILDACGSGKAVDKLILNRKDLGGSELKAISRMQDKTGYYVISSCAANADSYEASRYGQSLLTYSILQGIKGAALKENIYIDVLTIFNYARDVVPTLAKSIGYTKGLDVIQQPQLLYPQSGSFDIGIINSNDKSEIPLENVKPVIIRATLFEETKKRDILKLSQALNLKLNELSFTSNFNSNYIFVDSDDFPDSYSISGVYSVLGDKVSFSGSFLNGDNEKIIKIESTSPEELVKKLVDFSLKQLGNIEKHK